MNNIGWHTSIKNLLNNNDSLYLDNNTYQVFVGSPRRLTSPIYEGLFLLKERRPSLNIIVHTPYVVSLCKNPAEKITSATMHYYIEMAQNLNKCGVKYMVTHIGGLSSGESIKNGVVYIYDFCLKWLQATSNTDVILCLENDTGSKSGTKMGYIKVLASIVKKINNPRIRMCFDVEHAYGAGFDIQDEENLRKLKPYVSVIHYNAIPSYVEFGSHLDRHSTTSLNESKVDEYNIYRIFNDGKIPFIFEVEDESYVHKNMKWLKNKVESGDL